MNLTTKYVFRIEKVCENNRDGMIAFLKRHEDYSLFILGNFEAHGFNMGQAPNSGNFQLIRRLEDIVGVFCLTKRGTLLVQSDLQSPVFNVIAESCAEESVPLNGVIGEWSFCSKFWEFLKEIHKIQRETFAVKEVLYHLDLADAHYQKEERVRLLNSSDYPEWRILNHEYITEQKLPSELGEEELHRQFLWKVSQKIIWGLFIDKKLVVIAELNAKALDLGQVGGVYTSQTFRKQGLAKALMKQLIMDAKKVHHIRKLMIFTGESNTPARRVYESLGVKQVGYFGLFFGQ